MKRIAVIITRMISGGASRVVQQIIEGGRELTESRNQKMELTESGARQITVNDEKEKQTAKYEFYLFTGVEDIDEQLITEISEYCHVVTIPSLVRNISPFQDYAAYRQLVCELRKGKFDVVHTHTSKAGFIGRIAAAKAGVPVIIHSPHGTIYTADSNIDGVPQFSLGKKILQFAERFAGRKTTFLTTLSKHEKEICIEIGLSTESNTIVVHNGITCTDFFVSKEQKKAAKELLHFSDSDIVLVSVGRLSSEKGHSVLIEAFERLQRKTHDTPNIVQNNSDDLISNTEYCGESNLHLIIVGDGPDMADLQKQAAVLGLRYDILGRKQNEKTKNDEILKYNTPSSLLLAGHCNDVRQYLAAGDIFILPSLYEGFGIAVLEAMAAGLPVVVTNVGGLPEIIQDGVHGFLVSPYDSDALAAKINVLIASPEKRVLMSQGNKKYSEQFSTARMLASYFKLYDEDVEC